MQLLCCESEILSFKYQNVHVYARRKVSIEECLTELKAGRQTHGVNGKKDLEEPMNLGECQKS